MRRFLMAAVALGGWLMSGANASANTIELMYTGAGPALGGAAFTYDVVLTGSSSIGLNNGSSPFPNGNVTIQDLVGTITSATFTSGRSDLTGVATFQNFGTTPDDFNTDDAGISNVSVNFLPIVTLSNPTGTITNGPSSVGTFLGTLTFVSSVTNISSGKPYIVTSEDSFPGQVNLSHSDGPSLNGPSVLPLPAAVWGGMSLLGIVGASRLRRSRTSADSIQ